MRSRIVADTDPDSLVVLLEARCRALLIDPPAADRVDRIVRAAIRARDDRFYVGIRDRLAPETRTRLEALLRAALGALDAGLPDNRLVRITGKRGGSITVTPFEPQPEPPNLSALKAAVTATKPMTNLLDMLKETDLRLGFSEALKSPTPYEAMDRTVLQPWILLCLHGLGANGRLRARNPAIWGDGTTSCVADSKHFGAWDQNLTTQWRVRYGGRGIMIHWHVEWKSLRLHSQREYVHGGVHANSTEGFNDRVRPTIAGVFHHISPNHADLCFGEISFRWSQLTVAGQA